MTRAAAQPKHRRHRRRIIALRHGCSSFLLIALLIFLHLLPRAAAQTVKDEDSAGDDIQEHRKRLNAPMAVVLAGIFLGFLLMAFFAVYLRQCNEERSQRRIRVLVAADGVMGARQGTRVGIDPEEVAKFPTFEFSTIKGLRVDEEPLECAVCITEFCDDETLRLLPKCDHAFHPECIDSWLASHTTCPVCRACLVPDEPGELGRVEMTITDSEPGSGAEDAQSHGGSVASSAVDAPPSATNQKTPPRSRSVRERITGIFSRSHTTGHSLPQTQNSDRFTLRLPEGVRDEIINSNLNRTSSLVAFRRQRSSTRGYRTGTTGSGRRSRLSYERLDQDENPNRSFHLEFLSRTRSVRLASGNKSPATTTKGFFRSVSLPVSHHHMSIPEKTAGERSADSHWPSSPV